MGTTTTTTTNAFSPRPLSDADSFSYVGSEDDSSYHYLLEKSHPTFLFLEHEAGSGAVTGDLMIALLEPIVQLIARLLMYDLRYHPCTSAHVLDLFRLPASDATVSRVARASLCLVDAADHMWL